MVSAMLDGGARSQLATTRFGDVRWVPSIDSTNRHLLQEARDGAAEGTVVVADHQGSGLARQAVALDELTGHEVDRRRVLVSLLSALEDRYRSLGNRAGQLAEAAEYRRRCTTVGRVVRVELADETFTGTAADVSDEGHL